MPTLAKCIAIIGAATALTACANSKYDPQVNPNPLYFLTLHGYIAPALQSEIQLRFIQMYGGSNPACGEVSNPLAGLVENPARNITYPAHPDSTGHYEVRIPLDYYTSGFCHWIPIALSYTLTEQEYQLNPGGFGLLNYDNKESMKDNPPVFNFVCTPGRVATKDGGDNCDINVPNNTDALIYIRTNQSFTQKINIITKGTHHD